jgi:hypothetical protein
MGRLAIAFGLLGVVGTLAVLRRAAFRRHRDEVIRAGVRDGIDRYNAAVDTLRAENNAGRSRAAVYEH